jgi:hypothetical protein
MRTRKNNKSGLTGICFCNHYLRWLSYLNVDGKRYQQYSDTKELAILARKELIELYRD